MDAKFYEPKNRDTKIVAFVDVEVVDGITVKGFRVVRGGDGLFIGLPQREYKVDGLPRYVNQVVFRDTTLREQFTSELMTAYERWAGGETANPGAEASPAPG